MSLGVGVETGTTAQGFGGSAEMANTAVHPGMVNPLITTAHPSLFNPNVKDSRWLTLEVCREFTRNKCTRPDTECKFAHPPPHVEVQNGRVTCCFDSIKGKCQRKDPPCKYLHPPQHLREQLVQNGRNNLILKQLQANVITNQLMMPGMYHNVIPMPGGSQEGAASLQVMGDKSGLTSSASPTARYQTLAAANATTHSGVLSLNASSAYSNMLGHPNMNMLQYGYTSPYFTCPTGMITMDGTAAGMTQVSQALSMQGGLPVTSTNGISISQKIQRPDRLESATSVDSYTGASAASSASANGILAAANGAAGGLSAADAALAASSPYAALYNLQNEYLQERHFVSLQQAAGMTAHIPGMVPVVKRQAIPDKSGLPVYPASATQFSPLVSFGGQQQFVPVTQTLQYYRGEQTSPYSPVPGHPMQRY